MAARALTFDDVVDVAKRLGADVFEDVGQGKQRRVAVVVGGKPKGLAWLWMERVNPKKPRVPNARVIAVPVKDLADKELLLEGDPAVYFTEPHYDGYAAVLVRLDVVKRPELRRLLAAARDHALAAPGKKKNKKKKTAKRA